MMTLHFLSSPKYLILNNWYLCLFSHRWNIINLHTTPASSVTLDRCRPSIGIAIPRSISSISLLLSLFLGIFIPNYKSSWAFPCHSLAFVNYLCRFSITVTTSINTYPPIFFMPLTQQLLYFQGKIPSILQVHNHLNSNFIYNVVPQTPKACCYLLALIFLQLCPCQQSERFSFVIIHIPISLHICLIGIQ